MVENSLANLSINEIARGMEEEALEWECDAAGCSESDEEGWCPCGCEKCLEELSNAVAERTPEHYLTKFFRGLDKGWNISETRFCSECGLFKSTNTDHWSRKAEAFQYK